MVLGPAVVSQFPLSFPSPSPPFLLVLAVALPIPHVLGLVAVVGGERDTPDWRSRMRHNGRPVVCVSSLSPDRVNLRPGELVAIACPVCGRWRRLHRGMLFPHRAADGTTRCPGSGQRIRVDLSAGEWLRRLRAAERAARRAVSLQRAVAAELADARRAA